MYELIQVSENNYYIQSPAKIGLVKLNDKDVCLIDSGNDKDAGRRVRKHLDANGWHLTALEIADKILEICERPICFELILQKLFTH